MNFHELSLPSSKKFSAKSSLRAFPIDQIPPTNDDKSFTGIFNGLSVEIIDAEAIKHLYTNGFFGLSTKTKNAPQSLHHFTRIRNVTQSQYKQKLAWNATFTNQNPNIVMVNLELSASELDMKKPNDNNVEENVDKANLEENFETTKSNDMESDEENIIDEDQPMEIVGNDDVETGTKQVFENTVPTDNLVVDPFPIEETLALFPEEAFFLHFSLKCLKVLNFDQTHEFTTDELLERFCNLNPKFIERYTAYHFYRSKNWVVRSGLKFGGDFLLYYKGPTYYHASYVVLVNDSDVEINQLDMQSNYRVSETTKKDMIIATISRPKDLEYSNPNECLNRLKEFQITEIIPKRFTINQLS